MVSHAFQLNASWKWEKQLFSIENQFLFTLYASIHANNNNSKKNFYAMRCWETVETQYFHITRKRERKKKTNNRNYFIFFPICWFFNTQTHRAKKMRKLEKKVEQMLLFDVRLLKHCLTRFYVDAKLQFNWVEYTIRTNIVESRYCI